MFVCFKPYRLTISRQRPYRPWSVRLFVSQFPQFQFPNRDLAGLGLFDWLSVSFLWYNSFPTETLWALVCSIVCQSVSAVQFPNRDLTGLGLFDCLSVSFLWYKCTQLHPSLLTRAPTAPLEPSVSLRLCLCLATWPGKGFGRFPRSLNNKF